MPIVDLNTNKIIDCKKNSATWWHEKGHIEFSKLDKGIRYDYYQHYLIKLCVIFLIINSILNSLLLKLFLIFVGGFIIYYYLYEEIWCWIYSINRKDKWN